MHLKTSYAKWRPFYLALNVLSYIYNRFLSSLEAASRSTLSPMISCGSIYVNGKCDISIMPMRSDTLSAVFPPDCVGDHNISTPVPEVCINGHKVEIAHHNNQDRDRLIQSML